MHLSAIAKAVPPVVALAAGVLVAIWLTSSPAYDLAPRLPGADRPGEAGVEESLGAAAGRLITFGGEAPDLPGAWPRFRGADFTNVSRDGPPLARAWAQGGPPLLWQIDVGEGYAGAAVLGGRVYVLDYDPPDVWLLGPADVKDWAGLARKLAAGAGAGPGPARRVWECLSAQARAALERVAQSAKGPPGRVSPEADEIRRGENGPAAEADQALVLEALNALVPRRDFYDRQAFAATELTNEARRYLQPLDPTAKEPVYVGVRDDASPREVMRLNRILLDLAWPEEILRSRHGDVLRCLALESGRDLWRYQFPVRTKRNHGMSRTVPAVTEKYVVSLGPKCHVLCLSAETGELVWSLDLVRKYGTKVPLWYAGQCPLIDGDRAILAPGGSALMVAVDCATGEVAWETPNPREWEMTHSSIVPMEFAGRRMYAYCASGGVVGVDAENGRVLWETDAWKIRGANVPTPVAVGDGRLFVSGGYGAGSMMLRLREDGDALAVEAVLDLEPTVFGATQQTPVLYDGHVYGVLPKDAGGLAEQLVCMDLEGRHAWASGPEHKFGLGPFVIADGLLLALDDHGKLTMAEATPDGFRPLASAEVFHHGHEAWGPMAVAGGRLIVRDMTRMACLDLSAAGLPRRVSPEADAIRRGERAPGGQGLSPFSPPFAKKGTVPLARGD